VCGVQQLCGRRLSPLRHLFDLFVPSIHNSVHVPTSVPVRRRPDAGSTTNRLRLPSSQRHGVKSRLRDSTWGVICLRMTAVHALVAAMCSTTVKRPPTLKKNHEPALIANHVKFIGLYIYKVSLPLLTKHKIFQYRQNI